MMTHIYTSSLELDSLYLFSCIWRALEIRAFHRRSLCSPLGRTEQQRGLRNSQASRLKPRLHDEADIYIALRFGVPRIRWRRTFTLFSGPKVRPFLIMYEARKDRTQCKNENSLRYLVKLDLPSLASLSAIVQEKFDT